jgi:hypothetical protein
VSSGGTGSANLTVNNVLIGNGTNAVTSVAPGTTGNVLTSIGGAWVSNVALTSVAAGSNTQVQYNNANLLAGSANLTFDGTNLGLAGGTATGVAYLNGFKVLTTGSALVFNGTNLGLGVTPSAWGSGYKALQINNGGLVTNVGGTFIAVTANAYWDGTNYRYVSTAAASLYRQNNGAHDWQIAPSGTAGNAITFTQAMTLDASGNLGIGTSSPGARLGVSDGSTAFLQLAPGSGVTLINSRNSANSAYVSAVSDATQHIWRVAGTEAARIDPSNNLLVGTTTVGGRITSDGGDTYYSAYLTQASAGSNCLAIHNRATTGDNAFAIFATETSITQRGAISYNRTAGLTVYATTSDYRAKDIIGPVQDSGATIDALKVYEGQMKGATQSRPMLVAHEAQAVTPYAVTGEKDAVNEDGTPKYQQMDVSSLVPLLIAEIQSLRIRIAQLEAK